MTRAKFSNMRVFRVSRDAARFEADVGADQIEMLRRFIDNLGGKPASAELAKWTKKRSLDANAYAWVLIDKIAAATRQKKIDVYRQEIREIGGNSTTVCAIEEAVETLVSDWQSHGDGWIADVFESKIAGCRNVRLYKGSSKYDAEQMSILIDVLVQDAKELGIETLPPAELERLMHQWRKA
ncbi:MAG: hypothetical protein ABFC31_12365 [Clostridiaceae bacterium]